MSVIDPQKYTVLITGCSKGLGLELSKQFLASNWNVIAVSRKKLPITFIRNNLLEIILDINNLNDLIYLKEATNNLKIDVIINNAGIYLKDEFMQTCSQDMITMFMTHVISPLEICQKLFNNLIIGHHKVIIFTTGRMGSFYNNTGGGSYGYRISKAGANMLTKTMSIDLAIHNIKVFSIHPGWIKTDMGGINAKIDISTSARGIKKIILNSSAYISGGYYTYEGIALDW